MSLDLKRVRVWDQKSAIAHLEGYQKTPKGKRFFTINKQRFYWKRVFLVRVDSKNPIKIKQQNADKTYYKEGKYAARNYPFEIKPEV